VKEIEIDGKTFSYDDDSLMSTEMEVIQHHTGMTYTDWLNGLARQDIKALNGLVWVVRSRAGEPEGFGEYAYNLRSIVVRDLDAPDEAVDPTPTTSDESPPDVEILEPSL
jgi:hypothetical protein